MEDLMTVAQEDTSQLLGSGIDAPDETQAARTAHVTRESRRSDQKPGPSATDRALR